MTAPHIAGRADTLVIGLVALAHLLSHFYQVVLGPLFPLLKEEFGVSYTGAGPDDFRTLRRLRCVS
ncbi:MAG: hypothetical protein VXV97_13565, partial [Pseudomonadota bacterium]|nr:hypothetical protein [Pseudomonadota bacterium]